MKYTWQELSPKEAAEQAAGGNPAETPWGFFSSDDLSIGGAGGFSWFATADELLAFVSEVILSLPEISDDKMGAKIKQCREKIAKLQKPDSALLVDLNEVLESEDFGIEWWGYFDQLCEGEDHFSEMMRVRFYDPDDESDEENSTPINASLRNKFAEFLSSYAPA